MKPHTTIERFCIQAQPASALSPVRVLRVTDFPNDESKSFLHVGSNTGSRSYDRATDLCAAITSFRREFPLGRVEVETVPDCEIRPFRVTDLTWLFPHTYA